ncbi:helix-turn-helix domain-containing protein [Georgenia sp. MJ206]|uniref:helix-turn-helix domain-containing protein n=1 Tax=Georgenia wangjunii TaxID=3117730 RepID=UPI002F264496
MSTVARTSQPRFLSVSEVADELNVTERFVRKLIAQGDLDAVRIGSRLVRIRRTDLDAVLRPMTQPRADHAR